MAENTTLHIVVAANENYVDVARRLVGETLRFELVRTVSKNERWSEVEIVVFGKPSEVDAFIKKMNRS